MKKLILAAALTLSFGATASEKESYCADIATLGKSIMTSYQNGVPLSTLFKLIDNSKGFSTEQKSHIKEMATLAYEQTKYSSEKYQKEAIANFENQVFLTCIKAN